MKGINPNPFFLTNGIPATSFYLLTVTVTEIYIYKGVQPVELTGNSKCKAHGLQNFLYSKHKAHGLEKLNTVNARLTAYKKTLTL